MTIRCQRCHATVWVQTARDQAGPTSVACSRCGCTYVLRGLGRDWADGSLAEKARRMAKGEGVDLPGAYSMLLGIMTLEELRELGSAASVACSTVRPAASTARSRVHYDRAYQPAVEAGYLTPEQAAQRGKREAYAERLVERHKLSSELALAVADNRLSLLQAIRRRPERAGGGVTDVDLGAGSGRRTLALVGVLALVIAAAVLLSEPGTARRVRGSETRVLGEVELITSERGKVLGVVGPDPRAVLRAYCAADGRGARLEPLDVVPSARLGSTGRLGLMRDPSRPEELLSIPIFQDLESNHWRAGDGDGPLIARPAPEGAIRAVRTR